MSVLSSSRESPLTGAGSPALSPTARMVTNALAVNAGWFACVLGAAWGAPLAGPVAVAALLVLHWRLFRPAAPEWRLLAAAGLTGLVVDSALGLSNVFVYTNGTAWLPWLAPLWLVALWINLATALNHCLGWLEGRPWLASLLGAAGGAGAYLAGVRLGALEFGYSQSVSLAVVAAAWAVVFPALYWLNGKLKG